MTLPLRSRRYGFTLVELLVVVGIIAVLVAVLMPVIKGVRRNAKRALCTSNLRQIYQGAMGYAARYDGALPGNVAWAMHDAYSTSEPLVPWAIAMHREMFTTFIDGRLMRCPGDESVSPYAYDDDHDWRDAPEIPGQGHFHTSYFIFMGTTTHPDCDADPSQAAVNIYPPLLSPNGMRRGCIYDQRLGGTLNRNIHVANLKDVRDPRQILMLDRYYSETQTGHYYDYSSQSALAAKLVSNHPYDRVVGTSPQFVLAAGTNVLLADGSVMWMITRNEDTGLFTQTKALYHNDHYFQIYVDYDMHWTHWKQK